MLNLEVKNLSRRFGPRKVFEDINFVLETGDSLAVVGHNGSGKTTLLKTIIGLDLPSGGEVIFSEEGKRLDFDGYRKHLSLVAPYLAFYDSLSGRENLDFLSKVNGTAAADAEIESALEKVGLGGRGDDLVGSYSTGMKQRLKYAAAIIKEPSILFFDEPSANLDEAGKQIVYDLIKSYRERAIVIIATNEKEEYSLAGQICKLGG